MMYLFGLIWKPSRSLKNNFSDHEYVVNLDPVVKHCYSELTSISTMWCGIYEDAMKEYGLGPNNKILTFERVENGIIWTKVVLLHQILH